MQRKVSKMTKKQKLGWWLYIVAMVVIGFFVVPMLISTASTLAVLFGVALLVGLGLWSWEQWISGLITKAKEQLK
jgi:hypothetical protein